jgi:hypothetical protein
MPITKEHLEFHVPDVTTGWKTPPGYPAGIEQKVLAGKLDEENKRGNRTRLLRFAPGVFTTAPELEFGHFAGLRRRSGGRHASYRRA